MSKHTQVLFYWILSFKSVRGIDKIIFPDGQSVSSSIRVDLLLPVVGSWHCTRAYVLYMYCKSPPAGLAFLNRGTGTELNTVQQGLVRFNLIEDPLSPSLFPSSCNIYQWREASKIYLRCLHSYCLVRVVNDYAEKIIVCLFTLKN